MFAMLHGALPPDIGGPARGHPAAGDALADAVDAQFSAGLDLVTDALDGGPDAGAGLLSALEAGDTGADGLVVRRWRAIAVAVDAAAARHGRPAVAAATITGPFTLARRAGSQGRAADLGAALAVELDSLAEAGCTLVIVDEPDAIEVRTHAAARSVFRAAHLALVGSGAPLHAMLAITGGSAWEAGAETILDAPYASYLLDLIAGPDNWYLARSAPGERGIVCAALDPSSPADQAPLLVWAARYAASMDGRGMERVGIANASSLAGFSPEDARAALAALARSARFAAMEPDAAIAAGLDRRTFAQPPGRGAGPGRLPRA